MFAGPTPASQRAGSASGSTAQLASPGASSSSSSSGSWYDGYCGWLGKKREGRGLGNSLALGLGVATFQKRWFAVATKEQAVLYYKEDPRATAAVTTSDTASADIGADPSSSASTSTAFPLGFIPFSEILLVDHLASTAAAEKAAAAAALSTGAMDKAAKRKSLLRSASPGLAGIHLASPPSGGSELHRSPSPGLLSPPGPPQPGSAEDKAGRLFDVVASYRVYHLQADSAMDAMRWVAAIRESVREAYQIRGDRMLGSPATAALNAPQQQYATLGRAGAAAGGTAGGAAGPRTPRTPDHLKRFWSNAATPLLSASSYPAQYLSQVLLRDDAASARNGLFGSHRRLRPQRLSNLRRAFFQLHFSISSLDQPSFFDALQADFPTDSHIIQFAWNVLMKGTKDSAERSSWGPTAFRVPAAATSVGHAHQQLRGSLAGSTLRSGSVVVDVSNSSVLLARMQEAEDAAAALEDEEEMARQEQLAREAAAEEAEQGQHEQLDDDTEELSRQSLGGSSSSVDGGGLYSAASSRRGSTVLPPICSTRRRLSRHRRCLSDSMLPDSLGRAPLSSVYSSLPGSQRRGSQPQQQLQGQEPQSPEHGESSESHGSSFSFSSGGGGGGHRRDESFNLAALQARRVLNSTRPFHRRFLSSVYPLPSCVDDSAFATATPVAASADHSASNGARRRVSIAGRARIAGASKFHDLHYMLLNKYALYHAAAIKVSALDQHQHSGGSLSSSAALNPPFLSRILCPWSRMEAWLGCDAFLNLLLNDPALLNEVPLSLPLIWATLQARNHDTDPYAGAHRDSEGGSAFIDDACLRKNWMDSSVDGEDDGFHDDAAATPGALADQGGVSEEEARELREAREEASKEHARPRARAPAHQQLH